MLDFTPYGWKEALLKGAKIVGWYALSGAVASLIALLASYHPTEGQYVAVIVIMTANAVLAAIAKWLTTCKPQ